MVISGVATDISKANMRARKSVVMMLATVVATFFICLLPFRALSIWSMYATQEWYVNLGPIGWYSLLYTARVMFYINSASNPIVLYAMSAKFRSKFQHILCCRKPAQTNNAHVSVSRMGTLRYSIHAPEFSTPSHMRSSLLRNQFANGNSNASQRIKKTLAEEYPMV